MLHRLVHDFLDYFRLANFFDRSIQALTARLNDLKAYLKAQSIGSVKKTNYLHLVGFVAEFNAPSIHVRKSRVWTFRQFIISQSYIPRLTKISPEGCSIQRSKKPFPSIAVGYLFIYGRPARRSLDVPQDAPRLEISSSPMSMSATVFSGSVKRGAASEA